MWNPSLLSKRGALSQRERKQDDNNHVLYMCVCAAFRRRVVLYIHCKCTLCVSVYRFLSANLEHGLRYFVKNIGSFRRCLYRPRTQSKRNCLHTYTISSDGPKPVADIPRFCDRDHSLHRTTTLYKVVHILLILEGSIIKTHKPPKCDLETDVQHLSHCTTGCRPPHTTWAWLVDRNFTPPVNVG